MKTFTAIAFALCLAVAGCATPLTPEERNDRLAATTQAAADIRAELEKLPPGDPVRIKGENTLAQLERAAKVFAAAYDASETGNLNSPEAREAAGLVPYGNLILTGILAGAALYQRFKRRKAEDEQADALTEAELYRKGLEQTVNGVEAAIPEKSPGVKAALRGAQDAETRALVSQIKGD